MRTRTVQLTTNFLVSLLLLALSGCTSVGIITQPPNKQEIIATKELPEFLKTTPQPSIAMRYSLKEQTVTNAEGSMEGTSAGTSFGTGLLGPFAGGPSINVNTLKSSRQKIKQNSKSTSVTETRLPPNEMAKLQFIKLLEKEFMRAGFTLHDLTLQNPDATTRKQADFFIEVRDVEFARSLRLNEYKKERPKKDDYIGNLSKDGYNYSLGYNHFEGWIILSSSGEVCSMFDLIHYGTIPNPVRLEARSKTDTTVEAIPAPTLNESAVWMTKKITDFLAAQKGTAP